MKKPAYYIIQVIFFMLILAESASFGQTKKTLPVWSEGEMEIHHIYTGRGEAVFCIFPDGTNMLIDPGDGGPRKAERENPASPDDSRQSGEWIARYVSRLLTYRSEKSIDYAYITHFHSDHMGNANPNSPKTKKGGDYILSGLTEVAEYIPLKKLVDQDWPKYQIASPSGRTFENYKQFINWNTENTGLQMERFIPGSNAQFSLVFHPEKYPDFEVRNIIANGEIWTGKKNKTKQLFPKGKMKNMNKLSSGIKITYGDFDYFNGGDITGRITFKTPEWHDVETPVGKVLGPIEVCEANHHAWVDAMNENFVASTQPQVFILQVWNASHINLTTIQTMSSKELYPGDRLIIPTSIPELAKKYIGQSRVDKLSGDGGHAVIKVKPGGEEYLIYLLKTDDESMQINSVFGPFTCN